MAIVLALSVVAGWASASEDDDASAWAEPWTVPTPTLDLARELNAPVTIDDAYPLPAGDTELELRLHYQHGGSGPTDQYGGTAGLGRGLGRGTELRLRWPITLGEGRFDGNGDTEALIFHQLWGEADWLPTLAVQAGLRVPTGDRSAGVDFIAGLRMTRSLGQHRLHLSADLRSVNGDAPSENDSHLPWTVSAGWDYPVLESTLLIADVACRHTGNTETRLELALQHRVDEHHTIAVGVGLALDDGEHPALTVGIAYTLAF
jgi:hypothetical protein